MKGSPFTPEAKTGGWHVSASDNFTGMYWIEEAGEEQEAAMGGSNRQAKLSADHDSNNANLIAAAPRLYRTLKKLLSGANEGRFLHVEMTKAIEARGIIEWIEEGLKR